MEANLVNLTRAQRRQQARGSNTPTCWRPGTETEKRQMTVKRISHALRRAVWNRDLVNAQRFASKLTSLKVSMFRLPDDEEFDNADLFELAFDGVLHLELTLWLVKEAVNVGYRGSETFADLLSFHPEICQHEAESMRLAVQILKEIYEFELSLGGCASNDFKPPQDDATTACQIYKAAHAQREAQMMQEILAIDTAVSTVPNATRRSI